MRWSDFRRLTMLSLNYWLDESLRSVLEDGSRRQGVVFVLLVGRQCKIYFVKCEGRAEPPTYSCRSKQQQRLTVINNQADMETSSKFLIQGVFFRQKRGVDRSCSFFLGNAETNPEARETPKSPLSQLRAYDTRSLQR